MPALLTRKLDSFIIKTNDISNFRIIMNPSWLNSFGEPVLKIEPNSYWWRLNQFDDLIDALLLIRETVQEIHNKKPAMLATGAIQQNYETAAGNAIRREGAQILQPLNGPGLFASAVATEDDLLDVLIEAGVGDYAEDDDPTF